MWWDWSPVIGLAISCAELFGEEVNLLQCEPCAIIQYPPVTGDNYLLHCRKGTHKYQVCDIYRREYSQLHVEKDGGICVHSEKYHVKHRHCHLHTIFFTNVWHMIVCSMFYPSQTTPIMFWSLNWNLDPWRVHASIDQPSRGPVNVLSINGERHTNVLSHRVRTIFTKPSTHSTRWYQFCSGCSKAGSKLRSGLLSFFHTHNH